MRQYQIDFDKVKFCFHFASRYLERCKKESKSNDKINKEAYAKLVELDTKLGKTASKQLYECLENTTRSDIIKV